jgi:hypothetical protein
MGKYIKAYINAVKRLGQVRERGMGSGWVGVRRLR